MYTVIYKHQTAFASDRFAYRLQYSKLTCVLDFSLFYMLATREYRSWSKRPVWHTLVSAQRVITTL